MRKSFQRDCHILLVDDEKQVLETSKLSLRTAGHQNILICDDSREVMSILKEQTVHLIIMDIMMPHVSGKELLPLVKNEYPDIPVIMMTGLNDLKNVVECMKLGAFDYLDKPVDNLRLTTSIERALEYREVEIENSNMKKHLLGSKLNHPEVFKHIITKDPQMVNIFKYIEVIALTSRAVLITGETGTGKELIAESVHRMSGRLGEYVTVNVAGLDDTLFSDALFGHKKGAYTGADNHRKGLLEQAQDGTIFLDEIGDLSMASQVKLLRLLQEREYYPLGSDIKKRTNARFVVATSRDIRAMIKENQFRKDLYYRLQAHQVHIPSLRERRCDLEILILYFIENACRDLNRELPSISVEVYQLLHRYNFPGNIRELEAMVFNALSQHEGGELNADSFKRDIELSSGIVEENPALSEHNFLDSMKYQSKLPSIEEAVNYLIDLTLEDNNQNQTATAKALGITRQGLISRLKRREK